MFRVDNLPFTKRERSNMCNAALFSTALLLALVPPLGAEPSSAIQEATKLHKLFDDEWQWKLREYPEIATRTGDSRYNDKLTDLSAGAMESRKAHARDALKRIREIDRASLTGQDVLSYDMFLRDAQLAEALERFPAGVIPIGGFLAPYEWMPVTQMSGVHISISELPRLAPLRSIKDYDNFLARLAAYPRQVDQVIELMKRGMAAGWTPPAVPIAKVLPQIEKLCVDDVTSSSLYKPFESFPEAIAPAEGPRLAAKARDAIQTSIIPALKKLHEFMAGNYLPACRQEIAATRLPGGTEYYQTQIRYLTTTELSPREIHEIGLREVARIRKEMDEVIKRTGFTGEFPEFLDLLRTDPHFARMEPDAVLPAFREIAKRVDPELPKLFAELPRTPYGIREIPAYRGETAEHYTPGAPTAPAPASSMPTCSRARPGPSMKWNRCSCTRPFPDTTCRSPAPRSSRACPISAETAFTPPIPRVGHSTPKAWETSWVCTRTPTRSSASSMPRSTAPAAWWSIPACTHWVGPANRPSST